MTTELSETKIAAATKTFTDTGLDDVITVLDGDALSTLETLDGPVDFVLLDGWKELYLPVIKYSNRVCQPGLSLSPTTPRWLTRNPTSTTFGTAEMAMSV